MRKFILGVLIVGFGFVLWGFWEGFTFLSRGAAPSPGQERIFEVMPGEGFYRVARRLEESGLLTSAFHFKVLAKFSGHQDSLRVGEYAVRTDMRPMELLNVLSSGKSIERQITFPEGHNMYEMADLVETKGVGSRGEFLAVVKDPKLIRELLGEDLPSLEGYLFPETYNYTKFTPIESLVRGMVARFKDAYAGVGHDPAAGLSRHQLVTLASVIEKETGAPEERPLISSVFHNRLRRNMRLQSDPTILYGIWAATGTYKQNITREDILNPTPYNTYTVAALPVGPIANPGKDALAAAVQPATSTFLFFVSKNDGTHTFSESLEQHNSAVQRFQMDRKAREGKSWRDLSQRKSPGETPAVAKTPGAPKAKALPKAKGSSPKKSTKKSSAKQAPKKRVSKLER